VLDIIQVLLIEPAARLLPSRIAKRSLSGDLAMLYCMVDSNELNLELVVPFLEQIVGNDDHAQTWVDLLIWLAVFELVSKLHSARTPDPFDNMILDAPNLTEIGDYTLTESNSDESTQQIVSQDIPQQTRASQPPPTLCARCTAIDFDRAFSLQIAHTKSQLVSSLGPINDSQKSSSCPLCQLFAEMSLDTKYIEKNAQSDYELRAFSSLAVFGDTRRDVTSSRDRIARDVQDSVVLGVISKQDHLRDVGHQRGFIALDDHLLSITQDTTFRVCEVKRDTIDFNRMTSWLEFCRTNHSKTCNSSSEAVVQGLKVIDCTTRRIVFASKGWKYAALSYVWGSSSSAEPSSLNYLPDTIPATIEDAMNVTVQLGLQYLWIDRYCINQQNVSEKHMQVSQMDIVYSNAEITIIAAAGDNPRHGLPGVGISHRRPQPSTQIGNTLLRSTLPDGKFAVQACEWSKRGWTYQEAILSRRRLVFTEYQVYFQCNGMHCCESILKPLGLLHVKNKQRMKAWNGDGPFSAGGLGKHHWELLDRISEFTRRRLTYESDILNAMSGIFNAYSYLQRPVFNYFGVPSLPPWMNTQKVGIAFGNLIRMVPLPNNPENGLATGLCWFLESPSQRRPGFPSWSWAGWKGQVSSPRHDRFRYYYGFPGGQLDVKIWIELKDKSLRRWKDVVTSLDGLRDCSPFLHIEASTVEITVQYLPLGPGGVWKNRNFRTTSTLNRGSGFYAKFELGNSCVAYSYLVLTEECDTISNSRLTSMSWIGIVFGEPCLRFKDIRTRGAFVLLVGFVEDTAERIGHINLVDFESNWPGHSLEHFLPICRQRLRLG